MSKMFGCFHRFMIWEWHLSEAGGGADPQKDSPQGVYSTQYSTVYMGVGIYS